MILDSLINAGEYIALHPGFAAGFAQLHRDDLATLPIGRHTIDGDRLILIIGEDPGRGRNGARLEAHQKYIDIQFAISGDEEIGWRPITECASVSEPYSAERDIEFFADASTAWFAVPPGRFAIFFPHDAHAPLAGTGLLRKAVVKVAVPW